MQLAIKADRIFDSSHKTGDSSYLPTEVRLGASSATAFASSELGQT